MLVQSYDGSSVEITPIEGDPHHVTVRLGLNGHKVENDYIVLLHLGRFLQELKQLESQRSGKATLEGTEDFSFVAEAQGKSGAISVLVVLHKHFGGMGKISLQGEFTVAGEHVLELVRGFENLLVEQAEHEDQPY